MSTAARQLASVAHTFARAWWRSALVMLGLCLVGAVAVWAYALSVGPWIYESLQPNASTVTAWAAVSVLTVLMTTCLDQAWKFAS